MTAAVQAALAAAPAAKPIGRRPQIQVCDECHTAFWDFDGRKRFCKPQCRQAWHHREQARGKQLLETGMALRKRRERGAFTKLTRLLDDFIAEDRRRAQDRAAALKAARADGRT